MNHSILNSLRVKMLMYSVVSLVMALITETGLGIILCFISSAMGTSSQGFGYQTRNIASQQRNWDVQSEGAFIPQLREFRRLFHGYTLTILVSAFFIGVFLFVIYFMFLTRRMTRDLSYISDKITMIAKGNLNEPIEVNRNDEIGEIALRINDMSDEIRRLMTSEREALQTNKDLITCVAHDLRTPLTSVIGYLQLAMDTEKYSEQERQKFARIASSKANRLEGLIQDLFSYTKLMSGEITLHKCEIDLVKLMEQMVEEFYPLFEDNQLEYHFYQNVDTLPMLVDPELIARAVQNLFGNAVKYGRDGKQIIIEVEKKEKIAQIRVTNYGLIIPKESLNMIFEKFYRVEESRSTQTGGTGLGLNIAKEIVTLHDGEIFVSSGVQGTVFTIELPLMLQNAEDEKSEK